MAVPYPIINDTPPWTQAIAGLNQFIYSTTWTADEASDILVYSRLPSVLANDITQLVPSNEYTVQFIGDQNLVQVTFLSMYNPPQFNIVTIMRNTPSDRMNLYTNTNFTPSMLNSDFGTLVLVDQQNEVYWQQIIPRYNNSETVNVPIDTILPILAANQFWAKNNTNTAFIAVNVTGGSPAPSDGPYILYTLDNDIPQGFNLGGLTDGILKQSVSAGISTPAIAINGTDYYGPGFNGYLEAPEGIKDVNGNVVLKFISTANAINYISVINQSTGNAPGLISAGGDANVDFDIQSTGTGIISLLTQSNTGLNLISGTNYQHQTSFVFSNTAVNRTVTFQDATGTVAFLSNIPAVTPSALTATPDTNVTITLGGTPATALLQAASITLGWTGQLSLTRGGTNASLTASNGGIVYSTASAMAILSGTATANLPLLSGSTAAPTWGSFALNLGGALGTAGAHTLSGAFASTFTFTNTTSVTFPTSGTLATTAALPTPAALTSTNDTNVTITLGGSPSTALLQATSLTMGWSGQLAVSRGGTGISAFGTGVATALGVNIGTAGAFVVNGGALGTPSSGTLTSCSGLPIAGITGLGTGVGTALAANTSGSGGIALVTSPSFTTPSLGAATATSITFGGSVLNTYTNAGTFTPGITFGGASVGLTYTLQTGQYNQIGGVVFFSLVIQINAIGSSTGGALVTGLPVSSRVGQTQFISIATSAVTFLGQVAAGIASGSSSISPVSDVSGTGQTQLSNTAFVSGSIIWCTGSYLA